MYYITIIDTVVTLIVPFLLLTVMNSMIARSIYLFYARYRQQRAFCREGYPMRVFISKSRMHLMKKKRVLLRSPSVEAEWVGQHFARHPKRQQRHRACDADERDPDAPARVHGLHLAQPTQLRLAYLRFSALFRRRRAPGGGLRFPGVRPSAILYDLVLHQLRHQLHLVQRELQNVSRHAVRLRA
ncbi:unnamed protein product, partial [Ixodes pacificus]